MPPTPKLNFRLAKLLFVDISELEVQMKVVVIIKASKTAFIELSSEWYRAPGEVVNLF